MGVRRVRVVWKVVRVVGRGSIFWGVLFFWGFFGVLARRVFGWGMGWDGMVG